MIPVRSNSSLCDLLLLNEINALSVLTDNQDRHSYAYNGLGDYERELTALDCSVRRSLPLEPLPIHIELGIRGFQSFPPASLLLPPFKKERNLFDAFNEPTLLGSMIQSYSKDIRANEMTRASSIRLPSSVAPSQAALSVASSACGPNEHDVVCSRGKVFYSLPGNVRFRKTIRSYIPIYLAASSKMDKSAVIDRIIDSSLKATDGPSRFLKYQSRTRTWSVMGHDQVRDKVGHALREAIYDKERESKIKSASPLKKSIRW